MKWLWNSAQQVAATYGADPRVYFALVVVTIPPFYLAFAVVVRDLMRTRQETGSVSVRKSLSRPSFGISLLAMAVLWLVPYVYVLLWGHNFPAWFMIVMVALMGGGATGLVRRLRGRVADEER